MDLSRYAPRKSYVSKKSKFADRKDLSYGVDNAVLLFERN